MKTTQKRTTKKVTKKTVKKTAKKTAKKAHAKDAALRAFAFDIATGITTLSELSELAKEHGISGKKYGFSAYTLDDTKYGSEDIIKVGWYVRDECSRVEVTLMNPSSFEFVVTKVEVHFADTEAPVDLCRALCGD